MRTFTSLFIALAIGAGLLAETATAASLPFIGNDAPSYSLSVNPANDSLVETIKGYLDEIRDASPPEKGTPLYRLAEKETDYIKKILRSRGYYEAEVDYQLGQPGKNGNGSKGTAITYNIETGPRIKIGQIAFNYPQRIEPPDKSGLPIREGKALIAQKVIDTLDQLRTIAEKNYCLLNVRMDYKVVVSRADNSANVTFTLQNSPTVHFSDVSYEGLTSLSPDYLDTQIPFEKGECFSQQKLDMAKLDLLQTNLLANVDVVPQSGNLAKDLPAGQSQPLDILFRVKERRHRTFSAGLEYSSDTGAGITLGWQHRNLLGNAEKLDIEVGVNEISEFASGTYTIPNFILDNQDLTFTTDLRKEDTDAFESTKAESSAILSRQFNDKISGTLGVAATESRVIEDNSEEHFNLISLPASLTYDNRKDILNPTSGWTATTSARPFFDISKTDTRFFQWTLSGATYFTAEEWAMQPTLALRAASGALTGAPLDAIPADQRFYVGGGGSVRGYAYQTVGELTDGDPDGGKSYGEASVELRLKIKGNWGMVLFVDGGYAYPTELPSFGNDFLWGAGIGVRYLTSFAPIRFDIAAPLQKREIDDPFQIYISIGQAF